MMNYIGKSRFYGEFLTHHTSVTGRFGEQGMRSDHPAMGLSDELRIGSPFSIRYVGRPTRSSKVTERASMPRWW